MAKEMAEQPSRLAALIGRRREIVGEVAELMRPPISGTVVVARGSSDHAATSGRYLLEMATRRPVASASPSLHTLYQTPVDYEGYVVIAASQSGRTPEVATVLERAGGAGARTIAITNDASSPLARGAEVVVALEAGAERAIPATKTVTAELVAFAMIASAAGDGGPTDGEWEALPHEVADLLGDEGPVEGLASHLSGAVRLVTVARGPLSGASAETALKLQETSSVLATAFSAADLRHGPIVLASGGLSVLAFAHPGPAMADLMALVSDLRSGGADVHLLGPLEGSSCGWSRAAPEWLAPVLAVVRGQQLAFHLARNLGLDPDRPPGLTKVTVT